MAPETQWATGVADVRPVVAAAVRSVTDAMDGGAGAHAVRLQLPQGLPPVVAGELELGRAVAALVGRALRRSPPGARVLVRALVAVGVDGRLDRVEVRVADRGASLPGEAGYWASGALRDGEAVHTLVRAGSARFAVETTPGGGLTAVLALPLV